MAPLSCTEEIESPKVLVTLGLFLYESPALERAFFMALNPQNLKRFTSEEARRNGQKGAKVSAEKRRQRKTFKELLLIALELQDESGKTNAEAIVATAIKQAKSGDSKARDFVRDTIGEKPADVIETHEKAPEGMTEMYAWLAKMTK